MKRQGSIGYMISYSGTSSVVEGSFGEEAVRKGVLYVILRWL